MITTLSPRVLGQRIRQLRTRKGFTQQDLAGGDYSKSYISAIEQGKTRPSLEALQRLASRLEVPAGSLLDPDAPGFVPVDPEAMPRRVRRKRGVKAGAVGDTYDPAQQTLQIARAELLIYTGRPAQALDILRPMLPDEGGASTARSGTRPLDPGQQQKVYYLASFAAVQDGDASEALGYVQQGMQLATGSGDREALERMRLILGIAYYLAGQPLSALEQHKLCMEAIKSGVVRDPNFKLRVLNNMAAEYGTLHDNERAVDAYRSSLDILNDLNSVEGQANALWETSAQHSDQKRYEAASAAMTKAANIYEALDNIQTAARMESKYGNILLDTGDIEQAEKYLRHSLQLAESLNSAIDRAIALTNLAKLALRRGDLDSANQMVTQAVDTGRAATQAAAQSQKNSREVAGKTGKGTEGGKSAIAARSRHPNDLNEMLVSALALSGEIAAQRIDTRQADAMFDEAVALLETAEAGELSSDVYRRYAQMLAGRGQHEQAARYFERAYNAVTRRER